MRKISIARRRIETTEHKQPQYSAMAGDPELLPFRRRNEATARLLSISGSMSHSSSGSDGGGIIEVELNSRQMASVNPLLKPERPLQVSGTLDRESGGVLLLNLDLSGNRAPKYISAKTIAGMLEISPRTVYRMHKQNRLSGIRIGRTLRFRFRDVIDFLGSCVEGSEG
ncbi:MAG: helix-turn-helix domain-containing protein [Acidobacteriota bacterium]